MSETPEPEVPSFAVVMDQHGNVKQTLELPPGVPFSALEFIAVSADGTEKVHLPVSTALTLLGEVAQPPLLPLPDEKAQKELFLASVVTRVIQWLYGLEARPEMASNPDDPPDVIASLDGRRIGIELCEVVYRERYATDHQLRRFENAIRRLGLGETLTEHQILFALRPAPDGSLRLPMMRLLERALRELFVFIERGRWIACMPGASSVMSGEELPESCRPFLQMLILDNIGPPADTSSQRPLIRFANHQQSFSVKALRTMVSGAVRRKISTMALT